jgi:signal transduction histidine kinase
MINNIIYAAARDVTPRIEMEENLRQSNKDLQESNAQKDKFIYIIAHDLRNPLNNILGISDLLHGRFFDNSPDDNYKLIQILSDSTHSMYELIENLLNWALSQTGKLSNKPVAIPLRTLTNKIINQVLPIAAHKNVNLVNNVPESITGWADEIMMGTVLRNLISNAVKFSFPENSVEVSCRVKETTVELEVRDHGIGIRPEVIEGLFLLENVYLKKGTSGEKGTGFGLPLCAELMRIQNGTIRAESEPGNGSSFFVEFPKTGPS